MRKQKRLRLIKPSGHNVEVTLTPLGDKIKWRIRGKVYCERNRHFLLNSMTWSKEDLAWNQILGGPLQTKKFLDRNRVVTRVVPITALGFSYCDWIRG